MSRPRAWCLAIPLDVDPFAVDDVALKHAMAAAHLQSLNQDCSRVDSQTVANCLQVLEAGLSLRPRSPTAVKPNSRTNGAVANSRTDRRKSRSRSPWISWSCDPPESPKSRSFQEQVLSLPGAIVRGPSSHQPRSLPQTCSASSNQDVR